MNGSEGGWMDGCGSEWVDYSSSAGVSVDLAGDLEFGWDFGLI